MEYQYLRNIEKNARNIGITIVGLDEVGVGSCAGPIVACAIIPQNNFFDIKNIRDSKKLSHNQRLALRPYIIQRTIGAYGISHIEDIKKLNPRRASSLAMWRALKSLHIEYDIILYDKTHPFKMKRKKSLCITYGEKYSSIISAASIMAKIWRDKYMDQMHIIYPQYNFHNNKGYLTKYHKECLRNYGYSPIHRTYWNI